MKAITFTNIVAGVLLFACGIAALFFPNAVADYYGFVYEQLSAKTTMRVIGGFFFAVGYLFIHCSCRADEDTQIMILHSLLLVMVGFAGARLLGLLLDGFSQPLMMYELIFESVVITWLLVVHTVTKKPIQHK